MTEADAGCEAVEAGEDALAQARHGARSMAGLREQVAAGPESRSGALVTRLLVVLLLMGGLGAAVMIGSCSSGSASSTREAGLYTRHDAIKVDAAALFAAYSRDEAAADKLYKGRLLEVSGVIGDVGKDAILDDAPEIVLSGGTIDLTLGVDCTFDKRYEADVAGLKKGHTVTVLGICKGLSVNVLLLNCQPVND